jgi:hypothetical protein
MIDLGQLEQFVALDRPLNSRFRMKTTENVKFCKPYGFMILIIPTKIRRDSSYSGVWHRDCL